MVSLEFFSDNPSGRTMALGSNQPLTEMSTKCTSWGKGGRCARLTTLPPSCAVVIKSENLNFLELSGPLQACNGTALPALHTKFVAVSRLGERHFLHAIANWMQSLIQG